MAIVPPERIQEAETAWDTTTSPKTTALFNVKAGDVLVAFGITEDNGATISSIAGGSLTWTQQQVVNVSSHTWVAVWTATVDVDKSMTVTFTRSGQTTRWFGGNVLTFRGSGGIGKSAKTNAEGAPSLALSTEQEGSAIVAAVGDWNAADGASRTWRTINGVTPTSGNGLEATYFRNSSRYTVYGAGWSNAGAAGSKTTGLSAPSGQKYSIVAVEIKGLEAKGEPIEVSPSPLVETDAVQTRSAAKRATPSALAETSAMQTRTAQKRVSVSALTEVDVAVALAPVKRLAPGVLVELGALQTPAAQKRAGPGLLTDSSALQTMAGLKQVAVSPLTETDLLLALTVGGVISVSPDPLHEAGALQPAGAVKLAQPVPLSDAGLLVAQGAVKLVAGDALQEADALVVPHLAKLVAPTALVEADALLPLQIARWVAPEPLIEVGVLLDGERFVVLLGIGTARAGASPASRGVARAQGPGASASARSAPAGSARTGAKP